MAFVNITLDEGKRIAWITLDRQDKLNALSGQVLSDLSNALRQADAWVAADKARCMLLRGAGEKAFAAGADIASMQGMAPEKGAEYSSHGHAVFEAIEALACPVIAVVHGFALGGGCELALACDFILASEQAKFGQPEVKLGLVPGFGGTQRLMRKVGLSWAAHMIYTGEMIDAKTAQHMGLVTRMFPHGEVFAEAEKTASQIATMAPLAVRAAKRLMLKGQDLSLKAANDEERKVFAECFGSKDTQEGVTAFLEKRSPTFKAE